MAWVTRGAKRYYYRGRRVGGRVERDYYGSGTEAELAAALDARRRAERSERAGAESAERERVRPAEEALDDLDRVALVLARAALLAAGLHQHDRGTWRLRRHDPRHE